MKAPRVNLCCIWGLFDTLEVVVQRTVLLGIDHEQKNESGVLRRWFNVHLLSVSPTRPLTYLWTCVVSAVELDGCVETDHLLLYSSSNACPLHAVLHSMCPDTAGYCCACRLREYR